VLLDEERARIHPLLRTSADRLDEALATALARVAAIGLSSATVCLSFSCRDTREFRETFPSWLVLQAFRVLRGNGGLSYTDLAEFLGEPVSAIPPDPARAPTDAAWWLAQARRAPARTETAALAAFPALVRGREALQHRASTGFTPWDGFVSAAGTLLDPTQSIFPISPSRLEAAAKCPFRFFLQKGLGVDALDEEERDRDVWLDHLTRGRILHELFAETMRALRQERRRPTKADVPRTLERGEHRLQSLRLELPPPSEEVFQHERDELLYDLRLFIEHECRHPDVEPIACEVPFGLPPGPDDEVEPLALADAVEIPLGPGRRLRVHGRIDRLDRRPDGTFETIDYKTGGFWPADWQGTFAGGTRLQHALYGVAAEIMLARRYERPRVSQGTYFFPGARGLRRRKEISTPDPAQLAEVLRDLADVIAAGTFIQAPKKEACRFCDFAAACGKDPALRAKSKFEQAPELAVYRRLSAHV
jgi:RecB family exonuclease